jgi:nucleoid-associated protein YgaU
MANMRSIHFTSRNPNLQVYALLGEKNPVITDGYGGWTVVNRPHRRGLTNWTGRNPFRQEIDIVISEFKDGTSVEPQIKALQEMASPVLSNPARTPVVRIHGDMLVHKDTDYIIEDLVFGATERNHEKGHRTRQLVTVKLLEYVDGGDVKENKTKPGHNIKYRTYTIKHGDTLQKIAKKFLGDYKRWKEIAKLNNIHDPRHPPVGKKIRIPPK